MSGRVRPSFCVRTARAVPPSLLKGMSKIQGRGLARIGALSSDAAWPPGGASCAPELALTEFRTRELAIQSLQLMPAERRIRLCHRCLTRRTPKDGGPTLPEGPISDLCRTARDLRLQASRDAGSHRCAASAGTRMCARA